MQAILDFCAKTLQQKGVDKFQCSLNTSRQHEMNLQGTDFSLIRTTKDNTLDLTVIKDSRKGEISLNRLDEASVLEALETALELARTSQQDRDYDVSPKQEPARFQAGPTEPDTERMYELLKDYSGQIPILFPAVKLMETIFSHKHEVEYFINSNGVDFITDQGFYDFSSVFSAKEGERTTSFNYTGFSLKELEKSLLERASLKPLLRQSVEHLEAKPFTDKFVGDVIIAPECLQNFLWYYTMTFLADGPMIAGISPFKEKLGQKVAHESINLSSQPVSPAMAEGYFVTDDGFAAENAVIIENGVLKSFLLSQYGAKKTGLARAKNQGHCWVLEPGNKALQQIIAQMKKGLLVVRYSGSASPNGDFSGIAKNSYYIENGQIAYPVTEAMISGNFAEVFQNVKGISQEQVNFGHGLIPYLLTTGVTVSGK